MHLLDDPIQKVLRARHHVQRVESLLLEVRRASAGSIRDYVDERTGEKRWVVETDQPDLGVELSLEIGEAIYQFRSALDHLVWQLVIANGKRPRKENAFPVTDAVGWETGRTQQRLKGVHRDAQALIRSEQPGLGRNPHRAQLLVWLDDLWNVDKHRHIYTTVSSTNTTMFDRPLPPGAGPEVFIHEGTVKFGTVVATVPARYSEANLIFQAGVSFGPGVSSEGRNVSTSFSEFDYLVGDIIERLRPAFPPGGPQLVLPGNPWQR